MKRPSFRLATVLTAVLILGACTSGGSAARPAASTSTETSTVATTSPVATATRPVATGTTAPSGSQAPVDDLPVLPNISVPAAPLASQTEQLLADIDRTKSTTLAQALTVFDLSMADLPGSSTSTLPAGEGFSATFAMAMITPYRDQLTPAQRKIVDSFDGTDIAQTQQPGGPLVSISPGAAAPSTRSSRAGSAGSSSGAGSSGSAGSSPSPTAGPGSSATSTGATRPGTSASSTPTSSSAPAALRMAGPLAAHPAAFARSPSRSPGPSRSPSPSPSPSSTSPAALAHDQALLDQAMKDWKAYQPTLFARVQGVKLASTTAQPKDDLEMYTVADNNRAGGCRIILFPQFTQGSYSDPLAKFIFAHELFHCIQFTWSSLDTHPQWLVEGSAEFAALDLYRKTFQPIPNESWPDWFTSTGRDLADTPDGHGYAVWALFETWDQTYHEAPYSNIEHMFKATINDTDVTIRAGLFDDPVFATQWTSRSLRSTRFSDAEFELSWPGRQPTYGPRDNAFDGGPRGVGTFYLVDSGHYDHPQWQVELPGVGVVGVAPTGGPILTHADAGTVTIGEGNQKWFCTEPGGCTCPAGTHSPLELIPLTPPMIFAFSAQDRSSSAEVIDRRWDPAEYCSPNGEPGAMPAEPADPSQAAEPVGTSNGDPHITTFNGLNYDFMTYGEFVTARDTTGGFTVQERHQQAGFGTAVSAVAIGDGTHRVTLTASSIASNAPVTVRVDGTVKTEIPANAGNLQISGDAGTKDWIVSFPDGSAVEAAWRDGFFVTVEPSAARAPHLVGLLGTPGLNFLTDLAMPDGSRAVPDDNYRAFAEAWWVTDATSLFDYDPGQNSETFRVAPNVPPVTPPTADAVTACRTGLGAAATSAEIDDCSFDATSMQLNGDDLSTVISGYQQQVAERSAAISQAPSAPPARRITVGNTNGSTSATSSSPESGPAAAPGSSLTLAGTFGQQSIPGTPDDITGTMFLTAGAVLIAKTQCPNDPEFQLSLDVSATAGSLGTRTGLCGSLWKSEVYLAGANSETHPGESYILINQSGTYTVSLQDLAENESTAGPIPISVSLVSDPTPTVIGPTELPAAGAKRALDHPGDSVVLEVAPGSGATWTITGGDQVCTQVYYIAGPLDTDKSPSDLGGVCWHHKEISIGPASGSLPIVIFDRDGSPVSVTVTKSP